MLKGINNVHANFHIHIIKKNKKVIKRLELWQLLTEEKIANS